MVFLIVDSIHEALEVLVSLSISGLWHGVAQQALAVPHISMIVKYEMLLEPFHIRRLIFLFLQYGNPDNSSRPGGPMYYSTYVSQDTSKNSTFHVVADNATVVELMQDIEADCGSLINNGSSTFTGSRNPVAMSNSSTSQPQPESSVQYYRASSLALTLDGYNNTAALLDNESAPATPLPNNYDGSLLACLNSTIGDAALLVDGDGAGSLFLLPTWLIFGVGMGVGAVMAI